MSVIYITPQRTVTGHLSRYVRRAAGSGISAVLSQVDVKAWFNPQLLSFGEREPVQAQFAAGTAWSAASALFTLRAAGVPAAGYNAAAATLSAEPSGRLFTASATIDQTPDAESPLLAGDYYGEFLVATSAGDTVAARGQITIIAPDAARPPGEYDIGGGLG